MAPFPVAAMQGIRSRLPPEHVAISSCVDGIISERISENILINGLKHAPQGGVVLVASEVLPGGQFALAVRAAADSMPA